MNLDENNLRVLGDILDIYGSKRRGQLYQKYFRRQFAIKAGMIYLVDRNREQFGGSPEFVEISVDGVDYIFKINQVDGEIVSGDEKEYPIREIYFFSLFKDAIATNCIWLTVDPDDATGYINGIDKRYRCIGFRSGRSFPVEPWDGEGQGIILMKALIEFCRFNAERFGISRLELDDIAERECLDRNGVFLISLSNMLLGKNPYYMKFGFRPVETSAKLKIDYNLSKMKGKTIDGLRQIEYLEKFGKLVDGDFRNFLIMNEGRSAMLLLEMLRNRDCELYSKWYDELYKYYGLEELVGGESRYELVL